MSSESPKFQSLLLSLPKLMDVKTTRPARGLAQWQWLTSWSHPTTGLLTQAGQAGWQAEVVSLSFLGLFLFSTFFLVGDPAVCGSVPQGGDKDTIMFSPLRNWSAMAGSSTRKRVEKRKKPRKERLTTSAPPASQGQQASGRMRPGGWPLGKTPSWSSHPSAWTETTAETGTWG